MILKTKNPLFLVPFKYGFIGAAMNILALVVLYYLGRHPLLLNPILDARIPLYIIFVFVSFKEFKEQYSGGILHFWQGMTMGMIAYSIMALGASLFIFTFSAIETTHFLAEYIRIATSQLQANKALFIETISEKTFNETLAQLPETRPVHLAVDYLLKSMPIGLFLTIILAVLFRQQRVN